MINIFISYRRADSRKDAGRIYDRLIEAFGKDNIFKDVDSIPLGKDFRGILREAVAKCDVQLVIIGNKWLNIKDEGGNRRLDNAGDFVRIEVESALQRDSCLVVPVLVDHAPMPNADDLPLVLRELVFKNAVTVRDDPDFHNDVGKIIRELQDMYRITPTKSETKRKVEAPSFDVFEAIKAYYVSRKESDWDTCRKLLTEIRESGEAEGIFSVETQEQFIWQKIEHAERKKRYHVVQLSYEYDSAEQTWEAIQNFWQDFPEYDPDNIAKFVNPKSRRIQTLNDSADAVRAIIGDPFDWCDIPAGEFIYGEGKTERKMTLPAFAMAKYPITYSQYQVFVEAKDGLSDTRWWQGLYQDKNNLGEQKWKIADHPRETVSWYDAMAFSRWLSWKLGGAYEADKLSDWLVRLPTEFEWEKAARVTGGLIYPYGNEFDKTKSNTEESGIGQTTPVTNYPDGASPYGVMDMSGNVWEWCLSDFFNPANNAGDENVSSDSWRLLRGGSWDDSKVDARAVCGIVNTPDSRYSSFGFRLCVPLL